MTTTLSDIHRDIIQTNILPRLDGLSLSNTSTSSSYLNTLCSDHTLWSQISKSTWPSISHPRLDAVISTFPNGHRSFFNDSFPTLITDINRLGSKSDRSSWPSELISAVDIRYQNDVIYSTVKFTKLPTTDCLTLPFWIGLNEDPTGPGSEQVHEISDPIKLTVDEVVGADKATILHLNKALTLNWIIIDPVLKRACNLSSVKPVSVKADWATNETHVRYGTVLPGSDGNEMVQCKIHVVLGVSEKGVGLKVNEVTLKVKDLDSCCLNGKEFMIITRGAIIGGNNVRRKVVDDNERLMSCKKFKEMKKERKVWVRRKRREREIVVDFGFVVILVSFLISFYFLVLR